MRIKKWLRRKKEKTVSKLMRGVRWLHAILTMHESSEHIFHSIITLNNNKKFGLQQNVLTKDNLFDIIKNWKYNDT